MAARAVIEVRPATPALLGALAEVERRAAVRFAEVGMGALTAGPPLEPTLLAAQQRAGLVWVAGEPPAGFAVALALPASLHLHEVSVVPEQARRGLGRALVEAVLAEAQRRALPEVTLVTFRDVPWNAPWYARLGFAPSPEAARRPAIATLRSEEARRGLDALGPRVVMARPTGGRERRGLG